jgi:hypothetical protein
MNIIPSKDAGDILHRGDIIGVRYDPDNRSWVNKLIINFQRDRELMPMPICEVSHVAVVGGSGAAGSAQAWDGWEVTAPGGGRDVNFLRDYERCQFLILRYEKWESDAMRYVFCDFAKQFSKNVRYSWTGCLHVVGLFPQIPGGRFCSEMVEEAAEAANVEGKRGFVDLKPNKISPARLCDSPALRLVATVYHKDKVK